MIRASPWDRKTLLVKHKKIFFLIIVLILIQRNVSPIFLRTPHHSQTSDEIRTNDVRTRDVTKFCFTTTAITMPLNCEIVSNEAWIKKWKKIRHTFPAKYANIINQEEKLPYIKKQKYRQNLRQNLSKKTIF